MGLRVSLARLVTLALLPPAAPVPSQPPPWGRRALSEGAGKCGINVNGLFYTGLDILVDTTANTPEACCQLCQTTKGCLKWSLQMSVTNQPGCHIKSKVGYGQTGAGKVTSGDVVGHSNDTSFQEARQGWGIVLMLFLVVVTSVYCVAGMLYNFKCSGSRGVHMIPHGQMWAGMPALVADGFSFFCRTLDCCGVGRAKSGLDESLTSGNKKEPQSWDAEAAKRAAKVAKNLAKEQAKQDAEDAKERARQEKEDRRSRRKSEGALSLKDKPGGGSGGAAPSSAKKEKKEKKEKSSSRSSRRSEPAISSSSRGSSSSSSSAAATGKASKRSSKEKESKEPSSSSASTTTARSSSKASSKASGSSKKSGGGGGSSRRKSSRKQQHGASSDSSEEVDSIMDRRGNLDLTEVSAGQAEVHSSMRKIQVVASRE